MMSKLMPNPITQRLRSSLGRFQPAGLRLIRTYRFVRGAQGPEFYQLDKMVEPGTIAIDVGANVGVYTYALARLVGKSGRVVAIEPIPELARYLRRATSQLGLAVQVEASALSNAEGKATLHIPLIGKTALRPRASLIAHGHETFVQIQVHATTLDALVANTTERVSFVKIDVEGHELSVLQGAAELIGSHHPNFLIEIEPRHSPTPIQDTFTFMKDHGYQGSFFDEQGKLRDIVSFRVNVHQRIENADGQGFYVSDFLFTPNGSDVFIGIKQSENAM